MALPRNVVKEDHRLEEQAEKTSTALAELRWHWTLDESNAKRVGFSEYAREVSRNEGRIREDANAFVVRTTNPELSMADARQHVRLSEDRLAAATAVATARGVSLRTATRERGSETNRVLAIASEKAEKNGTTIEDEAPKVAEWIVKSEQATENTEQARRSKTNLRVIAIEAQVLKAIAAINRAIDESRGVDLDEEAIDFLTTSRDNLKRAWVLLDAVLAGAADIDWDEELAKMTEVG